MTDPIEPESEPHPEDVELVRDLTDPATQIRGADLMLKRVVGRGRVVRQIDLRLRRVRLFDVDEGTPDDDPARYDVWKGIHIKSGGRSCRRMDDHPLIQVMLENRDEYLSMKYKAVKMEAALLKIAERLPEDDEARTEAIQALASAARNVARISELAMDHLKEVSSGVVDTMKAIANQTAEEVKLVTHASKLAQIERLAPAKDRDRGQIAGMTSAQLAEKRRLALEKEGAA